MTSIHRPSGEGLVTFEVLADTSPDDFGLDHTVNARSWTIELDPQPHITAGPENSIGEYDALDELRLFLDVAHDIYETSDRAKEADRAKEFGRQIVYLSGNGFSHAVEALGTDWYDQLQSGASCGVLLTDMHDAKDKGVASSAYIVAHVLGNIRHHYGDKVARQISLVDPRAEATNCDTCIYVDDWTITGNQLRRNLGFLPETLRSKVSIQLLAMRGKDRTLTLDDGSSIPIDSVYEAPMITDPMQGPSLIGQHGTANYGWQNRLIDFGIDIAAAHGGRALLPALTYLERPYRSRRDIPNLFRIINASSIQKSSCDSKFAHHAVDILDRLAIRYLR